MALPDITTLERLRTRWALPIFLSCTVATTPGCTPSVSGVDEDTYVEVMAHLAWVRVRHVDPREADSARAAVLDRFGMSGEELFAFADAHGDDVERFFTIMERVRALVDSLDAMPSGDADGGLLRLDSLDRDPS